MSSPEEVAEIVRRLAAPFDLGEVKFKPSAVSGNRALALAYVDARVIQDRLDEVLGVLGWQDSYKVLADGSVMCRLRLRIGDQWITKADVGGQSEQPDGGDRTKAAFSDALKRAAVKFGVGRYLYRLPALWADYDPKRRAFVRPPQLPAAALPGKAPAKPASPRPAANGAGPAGENLDAPIGAAKALALLERCRKLGWEAEGPNGWLAWLGVHPARPRGEITRRQAQAVQTQAKALAGAPTPAPAPAAAGAPGDDLSSPVTEEEAAELADQLDARGLAPAWCWSTLRVPAPAAGLRGLALGQFRRLMDALARLPARAPASSEAPR